MLVPMRRMKYVLLVGVLLACLRPIKAGTLVQFRTRQGDIEVELFDQDKPVTVDNFVRYVKGGFYQNVFFHRCLPGFVAQGGGCTTSNRNAHTDFIEYFPVPNAWGAITNEYNVGRKISNTYGTIAMAKLGGDPNSATTEWFFNLANNNNPADPLSLDNQNGGFTVFGHVIGGTNVLNWFNKLAYGGGGIVNLDNGLFQTLPVSYVGNRWPFFDELIYIDISLLQVQVKLKTDSSREISWNSISNRLNRVEFTTQLPPAWQTLASPTGTGDRMQVTDTTSSATNRFYRVRVEYP
jgi:cyclophilin family peptidyl-prolyl cis-trans isomerase